MASGLNLATLGAGALAAPVLSYTYSPTGDVVSPKESDYSYSALGQFTTVSEFNFIGVGPRLDILTGAYSYDDGGALADHRNFNV